ncbi:hypothetical protein BZA77DRAFT_293576 [Pyronema omphalodes]|nr:hypothetical protein BZA77DRAFT_293576 [Pyronema omphalodes]
MKNLLLMLVAATAVLANPAGGVAEPVSAGSPSIANDIIPGDAPAAAQGAQPGTSVNGAIPSQILGLGADFPYEVRAAGPDGYCYETACKIGYGQGHLYPCFPKWVDKGLRLCYYSFGNVVMRRRCCTV